MSWFTFGFRHKKKTSTKRVGLSFSPRVFAPGSVSVCSHLPVQSQIRGGSSRPHVNVRSSAKLSLKTHERGNCENALKTDNTFTSMRSVSTPLRVLRGIQPMNNAPLWKRLWCIYSKEKKKCYFFFKTPRISNSKFSLLFLNNHWVILLVFPFRPLPQRSLLMPMF